jgi:hypothetical protein
MAGIGANSSDKQVVGSQLYTGLANLKIVAINPTFDEIKAMGINAQKEPEYLTQTDKGDAKLRIDFYLGSTNPAITFSKSLKTSLWLENRVRTNKEGTKVEWINKFGSNAWSKGLEDEPSYQWFSAEGQRKAIVGETDLANFVKAWANIDPKDQAIFEDINALASGDLKEVLSLYKAIPTNSVKHLLGVKDGKYQTVYTKFFARSYQTNYAAWKKALEGDYGKFDADYQNDLNFKAYQGSSTVTGNAPTNMDVPAGAPAGQPKYDF